MSEPETTVTAQVEAMAERVAHVIRLLDEGDRLAAEARRLSDPRRFILLRMRDAGRIRRLLHQADACLGEVARLAGATHHPLPRFSVALPGHPLAWWSLQAVTGVSNATSAVRCALDGEWRFAVVSLLLVAMCAAWHIPPLRLAWQGKWEEDHA
jgi:hypothetical protein